MIKKILSPSSSSSSFAPPLDARGTHCLKFNYKLGVPASQRRSRPLLRGRGGEEEGRESIRGYCDDYISRLEDTSSLRLNRVKRVETDAFGEVSNEDEVMGRVIRDYDLFFFFLVSFLSHVLTDGIDWEILRKIIYYIARF